MFGGGGGPRRPSRPPTHQSLPLPKLMDLATALEEAADGKPLTVDQIEDVASEQGAPRAHLYAALTMNPNLQLAREHQVGFIVCAGGCQQWGSLDRLEQLLRLRERQLDAGEPAFDVHVRGCLDKCEHAPVIAAFSPDGAAVIPQADEASVADAVAQVLGKA